MMSSIPLDLSTEILCRLTVKDVVRYRCVSKPWCSLIDTPYFRKLHLSFSPKSDPNLFAIFQEDKSNLIKFLDLEFPSLLLPRIIPNQPRDDTKCIVCSCNGLVALCNKVNTITLWNPFTGESRKLPQSNMTFPKCRHNKSIAYGFGYDPTTADYKLLKSVHFSYYKKLTKKTQAFYNLHLCCAFYSKAEIYSLKTNSWREISGCPISCGFVRFGGFKHVAGILAENALHWLVSKHISMHLEIAAFDLVGEELYSVPIPHCFYGALSMTMAALDGHLSVAASYENGLVHVWVMEEYGVKESWNKKISMMQDKGPLHDYSIISNAEKFKVLPLAYSRGGDKLLANWRGKLFWYDLESEKAEFDDGQGILVHRNVIIITASLVALEDTSEIDGNRKQIVVEDENSKNKKKEEN